MDGVYRIRIHFNGNADAMTMRNLSGTIPPKQTFVLCNGAINDIAHIPRDAEFAAGPSGDDALILEKNQVAIDIFGSIGCDPGEAWEVEDISTQDMTLVRKSCINSGVTIAPPNCEFPTLVEEWIAYPTDDFSHLGMHICEEIEATIKLQDEVCHDNSDGEIIMTPSTGIYPYTYSIDNNTFQNDSIFSNLSDDNLSLIHI